jgi:hypothetical protein
MNRPQLTAEQLIGKMLDADEWAIMTDPITSQQLLLVRNFREGSGVAHEEEFTGPNPMDMEEGEFVWFYQELQQILKGWKKPAVNHVGTTVAVYTKDKDGNAESITYVPPGGSYPETQEWQHTQGWSWHWKD